MVAFAVISALGQRGVRVPEDVSVIGFDGLALGARFNPPLTTIRQPIADMGHIAIELAEKQNTTAPWTTSSSNLNFWSVAPPRDHANDRAD